MARADWMGYSMRAIAGALCIALLSGVFLGFVAQASCSTQPAETLNEEALAGDSAPVEGTDPLRLFRYLDVTETIPVGQAFDATGCVGPKGYDYSDLSYSVSGASMREMSGFVEEHPNYLNMASWDYAGERIVFVEMRVENTGTEPREVSFRPLVLFAKDGKGCEHGPDSLVMQEVSGLATQSSVTHEKDLPEDFFLIGPGEIRTWSLPFVLGENEPLGLGGFQLEGRFDGYHRIVFELE